MDGFTAAPDLHSHRNQDALHAIDVGQRRHVAEGQRVFRQQGSCHQHQGGILGAADTKLALQSVAALDLKMGLENVLRRGRRGCHPCYFLPNSYFDGYA
ncbi:MAG: Uncharacterised protein [Synechococcus sp. MIT S9220]|nr:MAG: Uncharacterised protein [Synechococcus sp. MIT S9220]